MSRFITYDRIEQGRDVAAVMKVARDEWVRNKADELASQFPECVMDFYRTSLGLSPYGVGLDSDAAQDAYAVFVEAVCLEKAKKLRSDKDWQEGEEAA